MEMCVPSSLQTRSNTHYLNSNNTCIGIRITHGTPRNSPLERLPPRQRPCYAQEVFPWLTTCNDVTFSTDCTQCLANSFVRQLLQLKSFLCVECQGNIHASRFIALLITYIGTAYTLWRQTAGKHFPGNCFARDVINMLVLRLAKRSVVLVNTHYNDCPASWVVDM